MTERARDLAATFRHHLAFAVTAALFAAAAARVLVVSRLNVETAMALLQTADPFRVLMSTLAFYIPAALGAIVVFCIALAVVSPTPITVSAAVALGVLGAIVVPWPILVVGVVAMVPVALILRLARRNPHGRVVRALNAMVPKWLTGEVDADRRQALGRSVIRRCVAAGLVLGAVPMIFVDTPWTPTERVVVDGATRVAHVLQVGPAWAHLMDADTRTVEIVPSEAIESRAVCELADTDWELTAPGKTPLALAQAEMVPDHPACDSG